MITTHMLGLPANNEPTAPDWKPTHPVHERPAYLVRAMEEEERLGKELIEAADRHEMGDINNPEPTFREMQRVLRAYNRAAFRLQQARERYTAEMVKAHEQEDADWRDDQEMYNDLRHGG